MKPIVSTIIPVLNDNDALRNCLAALSQCAESEHNQIIVADGGASDECRLIAEEFGVLYLRSERGRGRQMNGAAKLASGEWMWFLHADCIPPRDAVSAIINLDARALWGCFRHRIDAPSVWLRVIEAVDNLRARVVRMPYGDQGVFVRNASFRAAGGFDELPLLEDVLLTRKLAKLTAPCVLHPVLCTDARRWLKIGVFRTTWTNWRIVFEFILMKKSPSELAAIYFQRS